MAAMAQGLFHARLPSASLCISERGLHCSKDSRRCIVAPQCCSSSLASTSGRDAPPRRGPLGTRRDPASSSKGRLRWSAGRKQRVQCTLGGTVESVSGVVEQDLRPASSEQVQIGGSSQGELLLREGPPRGAGEEEVPRRLLQAAGVFFRAPSVGLIVAGIAAVLGVRTQYAVSAADGLIAVAVACWWMFQEWLMHHKLLHSSFDWFGRRIHEGHHAAPFHHISIDDPPIILFAMVASSAVFFALLGGNAALTLTAAATYFFMGGLYEWTHFLVHTKVPMKSPLARAIKNAHVSHHLNDHSYYLSFTCPPIDYIMGTVPPKALARTLKHRLW